MSRGGGELSKEEKQYIGIYLKNRKKGTDWLAIVKELRLLVSASDAEKLDDLKWEILRLKKKYDINDHYAIYTMVIAIIAIFFNIFDFREYIQNLGAPNFIAFMFQLPLAILLSMIPFMIDTASYMKKGHYYDIYYQIILEEIGNRAKKKEQDAKQKERDERFEYVIKTLGNRNPFRRLGSLLKDK